jgi:hypothetical protein
VIENGVISIFVGIFGIIFGGVILYKGAQQVRIYFIKLHTVGYKNLFPLNYSDLYQNVK